MDIMKVIKYITILSLIASLILCIIAAKTTYNAIKNDTTSSAETKTIHLDEPPVSIPSETAVSNEEKYAMIPIKEENVQSVVAEIAITDDINPDENTQQLNWFEIGTQPTSNIQFQKQAHENEEVFTNAQIFPYKYTDLEGVLAFRGGPFRDSPSWGYSTINDRTLEVKWQYTTPFTSSWGGGGGWTGQAVVVKWPDEIKNIMNLYPECKDKKDFVEVIFASLNGNIYFIDLATGEPSRDPIKIGNPFKGSISLDPRGYPLLYAGDGIADTKNFGFRLYSLIDSSMLLFQNGRDSFAYRTWGAFDSSAIFNPETDTLFVCGENGLFYKILLNTEFDLENASIQINPIFEKYRYKIAGNSYQGIEKSPVFYNHYAFFADNGGWIQAIDLNNLEPMWTFNNTDDTDATITLSIEDDTPYLYSGNEVDHQGTKGISHLRKINGLDGSLVWEKNYECLSLLSPKPINGGLLATSVIGKKNLNDSVIFTLARYKGMHKGLMVALSKETGEELWQLPMGNYAWSSPVDFYDSDGNGYLIQCNSAGDMLLIDGLTGQVFDTINLESNIESSPVIYNDWIVVATRGGKLYCVEIK